MIAWRNIALAAVRCARVTNPSAEALKHHRRQSYVHWDVCSGSPPIRLKNPKVFFGIQLLVGLLSFLALLIIG